MGPSCVHTHLPNKSLQNFWGPKQYNGIGISQLLFLNGFEQFLIYQGGEISCARPLLATIIAKPILQSSVCCKIWIFPEGSAWGKEYC